MLDIILSSAGSIFLVIIGFIFLSFFVPWLIYKISPKPLQRFFDDVAELPEYVKLILFFIFSFLIYLIFTGSGKGSEGAGASALRETILHLFK